MCNGRRHVPLCPFTRYSTRKTVNYYLSESGSESEPEREKASTYQVLQGVSHTPLRGVNTPPPASGGNEGEKGRGGRGKGKRRGEGIKRRDPQRLVDTPHVRNPEKYPARYIPGAAAPDSCVRSRCGLRLSELLVGWCYAPENREQSFVDPLCPRKSRRLAISLTHCCA